MVTADELGKRLGRRPKVHLGERCPIIAVCTCESMIDVTDVPGAKAGDEVVLVGEQAGKTLTAMEFAEMGGIGFMNLLTKTGPRVPRVYWRGGACVGMEALFQEERK